MQINFEWMLSLSVFFPDNINDLMRLHEAKVFWANIVNAISIISLLYTGHRTVESSSHRPIENVKIQIFKVERLKLRCNLREEQKTRLVTQQVQTF